MTWVAKRVGNLALAAVLTIVLVFSIATEILPIQPALASFPGANSGVAFVSRHVYSKAWAQYANAQQKVQFNFRFESDLPRYLPGSRGQLRLWLTNLGSEVFRVNGVWLVFEWLDP